jgi:hypothetical protein
MQTALLLNRSGSTLPGLVCAQRDQKGPPCRALSWVSGQPAKLSEGVGGKAGRHPYVSASSSVKAWRASYQEG